jgi:sugar phosphate isomerase/epimerase
VGSPAVKVYYDVANAHHMGYNIYQEIRDLGSEHIAEFHLKENGYMLGHGRVDFRRVREVLEAIDYRGWLIVESAVEPGVSIQRCYQHNQRYARAMFGA